MSDINFTLATCIRNEGPYILEWYLYYKNLGVSNFVVYSNDNTDGSDELLSLMHEKGMIDWRPRKLALGESPQLTAYSDLSKELFSKLNSGRDYLAWFDMDEFLVLNEHNTIQELIDSFDIPDALVISWKHFGSSGHTVYDDAPTIDKFLLCSSVNPQNKLFKTISKVDSDLFRSINNHHPIVNSEADPRVIYATKERVSLPESFLHGANPVKDENAQYFYDICQLNHYAIRSKQEFEWKRSRGNGRLALDAERKHFLDGYFAKHDSNEEVDTLAKEKYSLNLKNDFNALPKDLLLMHRKIIDGLTFSYGKVISAESNQEKIVVEFEPVANVGFSSKFLLDNKKIVFTPGREISLGGVFVTSSDDVHITDLRIVNDNLLKNGEIGLPSPGMKKQFNSKFNSSSARFSFQFCSHLDLANSRLVAKFSNGEEILCGSFREVKNNQPALRSFSHELEFTKLAAFITNLAQGRPILYIANKGNFGDALIRKGAISFFNKYNINYVELKKDEVLANDFVPTIYKDYVCIYGGSGAWCAVTPGAKSIVDKLSKLFTDVIVLPSTYEISGQWENVYLWARGNKESFYKSSGYFCHDMAFSLPTMKCIPGNGDGFFYRKDKEASGKMIYPKSNRDISFEGNSYSEITPFFAAIAEYENIYTDRLHVAIAACLLNKNVYLSSSSYFKIREIYKSSLEGFFEKINFVEV